MLGTRDYVHKNGFTDVVLGLSGGIDSSLVACVAADALGPEHVHAVALPTRYTSDLSGSDAAAAGCATSASTCGRCRSSRPSRPRSTCWPRHSPGVQPDVTEENLQGRLRMAVLMALNNKFGWLVLICGNKSELAVGYTTIYGVDMAGGFAVIKDVFKTRVYELARHRNSHRARSSRSRCSTKPPSAELRPGQRDDQSLPPYEVLDPILAAYVEQDMTLEELLAAGCDRVAGRADRPPRRRGRVEAPPVAPRGAGHPEGVRPGPSPADHQPLLLVGP